MPLTSSDGHNLGTLCVIDKVPRHLSDEQREALAMLARQVIAQMELRMKERQFAGGAAYCFGSTGSGHEGRSRGRMGL